MKKSITVLLAAMMVLIMSSSVFAGTMTTKDAVDTALKDAGLTGSQVKKLEAEPDDDYNHFEVEFVRKSDNAEFEYEISARSGAVTEKAIDYSVAKNTSKKKIGKKKAQKIAARDAGVSLRTVRKGSCTYRYKKKQGKYTIRFRSGGRKYEYEIQAATGKIMESEWEMTRK